MRRTVIDYMHIFLRKSSFHRYIYCMSCMLQYVGFDGSKRISDRRKDENYLNGMHFIVNIVYRD